MVPLQGSPAPQRLHSFPTRRSSDLIGRGVRHGRQAIERPFHVAGQDPAQSVLVDAGLVRINKEDRKSTRLNSSHRTISYAVFCLKKKKKKNNKKSIKTTKK